jgi:hypothetical protein
MTSTLTAPRPSAPLDDVNDFDNAVVQVMIGRAVAVSFGSSFGLVANGMLPDLGDDVTGAQVRSGADELLPVALPSARLAELIDPDQIHPSVRSWILDGHGLARAFGSQCFFRVPIRRSVAATLPAHLVAYRDGVPYLQSIDPSGLRGGGEFVTALWRAGVAVPAVVGLGDVTVIEVGRAGLQVVRDGAFPAAVVRMVARHAGQPDRIAA